MVVTERSCDTQVANGPSGPDASDFGRPSGPDREESFTVTSPFEQPTNAGDRIPERRRPGRIQDVSPHLIPLLRRQKPLSSGVHERPGDEPAIADLMAREDGHNDLDPARGIAISVVIGLVLWGAIVAMAFLWL